MDFPQLTVPKQLINHSNTVNDFMFYNKCVAYWYHGQQHKTTNIYYLLKIPTTTCKTA